MTQMLYTYPVIWKSLYVLKDFLYQELTVYFVLKIWNYFINIFSLGFLFYTTEMTRQFKSIVPFVL